MEIQPYKNNSKKHSPEQLRLIAASIRDFGWQSAIKIGQGGIILSGHGRYQAYLDYAEQFKLKEPWVIDQEGKTISGEPESRVLTIQEEKEYRLRDNKIAESPWDIELLVPELKELIIGGMDLLESGFSEIDLIIPVEETSGGGLGGGVSVFQNLTFRMSDEQAEKIKEAIGMADGTQEDNFGNEEENANKLYAIVSEWLRDKM